MCRKNQSTSSLYQLGWPGGRSAREPLLSGSSPGRPGGRPVGSTVKNLTVGRSTGRANLPLSSANRQNFNGVINTPFELVFQQDFQELKFAFFLVFIHKFSKDFLSQKDLSSFVFKGWKNQRKIEIWDICVVLHFYHIQSVFPSIFLCYLISKHLDFPHLSLSTILFIGSFICGKIGLWLWKPPSCNPPWFVISL